MSMCVELLVFWIGMASIPQKNKSIRILSVQCKQKD